MATSTTARLQARVHRAASESLRRAAAEQRALAATLVEEHTTALGVVITPRASALREADKLERQADAHGLTALDLELPPAELVRA